MHLLPILPPSSPSSSPGTTCMRILALHQGALDEQLDWLATEEPLEMRLQGPGQEMVRVAVTMRTPGHDHELVVGFLYTEGLIHARHEIVAIQTERPVDNQTPCNVVTVHLTHPIDPMAVQRNFYTTSSCGICGKASLDQGPKAPFHAVQHDPPVERLDDEFPIRLTKGRHLDSYNTGVQSSGYRSPLRRGETLDLSQDDGRRYGIRDGECVRISSRRGSITAPVRYDATLRPGLAFMTLHFQDEVGTNLLTIDAVEPKSGTAEFKAAAIRIDKLDTADEAGEEALHQ